ncbi:DUF5667 domain-containing protein [Pseudonocardia asaccharolytica]|uniref:DUF5667 domain-containing protein n=1 Tax=Pseudonocardia asaccharolytica DSM 44247 = NBRC 16224 TaxID=1123024 RepID=A0A511D8K0_9PSEU|nr:DUF5667 domain-containing protein [Pseudonocardia asaccharolytica]GEL19984.1 hypothetical protein PA7_38210 [Pseudonocardia asaccharolytica DSM 44247 = NBRC 16224]
MPAGQGKDEQRFAADEDAATTGPPAADELAHEVALAAALDRSRTSLSPDPDATARMRARLFAALAEHSGTDQDEDSPTPPPGQTAPPGQTPPLDAAPPSVGDETDTERTVQLPPVPAAGPPDDGPGTAATTVSHGIPRRRGGRHTLPRRAADRTRPGTRSPRRRVGVLSAAALLLMIVIAGGGVFASRDALPGEALYGIKRIAESASLAMTFDDEARARRHLHLAAIRLDEVEQLVARQRTSAPDPALLESTIGEFDSAASEGSRMLLADPQATGAWLMDLRTWAATQAARLAALRAALPIPTVAEADQSMVLLERLQDRADALRTRMSCSEVTSGAVDDLGPLPAEGACIPRPDAGAATGLTGTSQPSSPGVSPSSPGSGPATSTDPGEAAEPTEPSSEGGLLSGLTPDQTPLGGVGVGDGTPSAGDTTTAAPTSGREGSGSLLPPITLPPLLPGLPGITIG